MKQPPAREGDTENLVFADTDVHRPKATESNRKNISFPQLAQTVEKMCRGWAGGKRDTAFPSQKSSPAYCVKELKRETVWG